MLLIIAFSLGLLVYFHLKSPPVLEESLAAADELSGFSHGFRENIGQEMNYGFAEINLPDGRRRFGEVFFKPMEVFNNYGSIKINPENLKQIMFRGSTVIIHSADLVPLVENVEYEQFASSGVRCKNFIKSFCLKCDQNDETITNLEATSIFFLPDKNPKSIKVLKNILNSISNDFGATSLEEKESETVALLELKIFYRIISDSTLKHISALKRKRSQLVYKDDYGLEVKEKWVSELVYFHERVVIPYLLAICEQYENSYPLMQSKSFKYCLSNENESKASLLEYIDDIVANDTLKSEESSNISMPADMNGQRFEIFVAEIVENSGWSAFVTKASGDHGADIVAEKDGIRLALQCKFYSSPVGNKSVQEVYSAMSFYECSFACVVTNSTFTPAAKQIASTTSVKLIHYEELPTYLNELAPS